MIDDDEKTTFAPRKFGLAAKTVVMPLPPRMTMNIDAEVPGVMAAPRMTNLRPTAPPPVPPRSAPPLPPPSARALTPRAPMLPPRYAAQASPQQNRAQVPSQQSAEQAPPQQSAILLDKLAKPKAAFDPKATRMVLPPLPHAGAQTRMHPLETGELIRGPQTRMARASRPARQMPATPPLPAAYLEPPKAPGPWPPPSETPTSNAIAAWRLRLQKPGAKKVLLGAAALLVLLVLLLPLSSSSANSPAEAQPPETSRLSAAASSDSLADDLADAKLKSATPATKDPAAEESARTTKDPAAEERTAANTTNPAAEERAAATTNNPASEERAAATTNSPASEERAAATTNNPASEERAAATTNNPASEERAAAMLLSGRRGEALALYQELAKRERSPGVEAMVLVLSQKVGSQ